MGTFKAHLIPGIYFIISALRWSVIACQLDKLMTKWTSSTTFATRFSSKINYEAWFKLFFALLLGGYELFYAYDWFWNFWYAHSLQHAVVYGFFALNAMIEIISMSDRHKSEISYS